MICFTRIHKSIYHAPQLFRMVMLTLVLAFVASISCQAQTFAVGNFNYSVTSSANKTVAITGPITGYTGSVDIPVTVTDPGTNITYNVTSIAGGAFNSKGMTGTLTIPEGITSIGNLAFRGCGGLTGDLVLPSTLTSIGQEAFNMCGSLTGNLIIPDGVTVINSAIFANCTNLNGSLHIPANVTSIANNAFQSCKNLKGPLTIPTGVTSIGKQAFYLCSNLTGNLIIPSGITFIGQDAFGQCKKLTGTAVIPSAVTSIGATAFNGCNNVICDVSAGFAGSIGGGAFSSTKGVWFNDKLPAFTSSSGIGTNTTYYIPEDDNAVNAQTDAGSIKVLYKAKIISTNAYIRYYHLGLTTVSKPLATITSSKYGATTAGVSTLYVNFPAIVPSGLKAYYGKEVPSSDLVKIKSIDNTLSTSNPSISSNVTKAVVPTKCGVVLMGDVVTNDTVFEAATVGSSTAFGSAIEPTGTAAEKGILSGSLTNIDKSTITNGTVYTFGKGKLSGVVGFYPYNGSTLNAHKAFLVKTAEMPSKDNQFILSIDDEDNQTTAISDVKDNGNAIDNAPYYNLQGVMIGKPTKSGIYIHKGKKIVIY